MHISSVTVGGDVVVYWRTTGMIGDDVGVTDNVYINEGFPALLSCAFYSFFFFLCSPVGIVTAPHRIQLFPNSGSAIPA